MVIYRTVDSFPFSSSGDSLFFDLYHISLGASINAPTHLAYCPLSDALAINHILIFVIRARHPHN